MFDFLNSDCFLDWMFMSLPGLISFGLGKRNVQKFHVPKPVWATLSSWNKREKMLYVRSRAMQIMGLGIMVWSLLLAFIAKDHQQRVELYAGGLCILLISAAGAVLIVELRR
ncbi:MAG: hypothetical protein BWY25_01713 [Chloroflexi bacterium ADurb.Bin222]|nr:MAG: hypothetical protein BWY25_01713 [Chloroflexi bacterium ADurb.Bin222]